MRTKDFNAVRKGPVGDGTVGDMVDWLEKLINVLYPENGIEYWADNRHSGKDGFKRFQAMPVCECKEEDAHHVVCYARQGDNEGMIINVGFYMRNDTHKSLTWVKTFCNVEETWAIARSISEALESILYYNDVPEIVEMADKMPRQHRGCRETSIGEKIVLASTVNSLSVTTLSGALVLDQRDWSDKGDNAKFYVESRVTDWIKVLANMKATFICGEASCLSVADIPGYVLSNRGVAGTIGYYVLPPGGNPLDDREYLGYFYMAMDAINAARLHRDLVDRTHLLFDYLVILEMDGGEILFECKAETTGHAIEHARNAYPEGKAVRVQRDGVMLKLAA